MVAGGMKARPVRFEKRDGSTFQVECEPIEADALVRCSLLAGRGERIFLARWNMSIVVTGVRILLEIHANQMETDMTRRFYFGRI